MSALPGDFAVHGYRPICDGCQLWPTCPISVDPRRCEALERDCAVYHGKVDEAAVGEEGAGGE